MVSDRAVNGQPTIEFPVDPGDYAVEVAGQVGGRIVHLRKSKFQVHGATSVDLRAVDVSLTATINNSFVSMAEFAIRRLGIGEDRSFMKDVDDKNSGEKVASESDGRQRFADTPKLLLSPGESYVVSCVARATATPTVMALWKTVNVNESSAILFSDRDATFEIVTTPDEKAPKLRTASLEFQFPDTKVILENALGGDRLITNRDRANVLCQITTEGGEKITFIPRCERFLKRTRLSVGAPLIAHGFAAHLPREVLNKKQVDLMVRRIYFTDTAGRSVDMGKSSFDFHADWTFQGQVFSNNDPRDIYIDPGKFSPNQARARLRYRYGNVPYAFDMQATGWIPMSSKHFKTDAPPGLEDRTHLFLEMAERAYEASQRLTNRPGFLKSTISWRDNKDLALAAIGNAPGGNLWLQIPFQDLEFFTDPFSEPQFIAHELMHNFGYSHDNETNRLVMEPLVAQSSGAFVARRWRAVDTGIWPVWFVR